MWSYYGGKRRLAHLYPQPMHDTIIEPFAGTAMYSISGTNWQKQVVLYDKYEVIVRVWHYLQQATEKDILSLPLLKRGEKVTDFQLSEEERWLIGFCINSGCERPMITATRYNHWEVRRKEIADNLHKIRHWKIVCGDYKEIENTKSTWFIDPPYQNLGKRYVHGSKHIDYDQLARWCKNRRGQVIVCESNSADWLPFEKFRTQINVTGKSYTESVWYGGDGAPLKLFEKY